MSHSTTGDSNSGPAAWSGSSLQPSPDHPHLSRGWYQCPESSSFLPQKPQSSETYNNGCPGALRPRLDILAHSATWWSALSTRVVISGRGGAVHVWSCGFLVTTLKHLTLPFTKAFRTLFIHPIAVEERREGKAQKEKGKNESSSQTYVIGQRKKWKV